MKGPELKLPIVNSWVSSRDYSFEVLSLEFVASWQSVTKEMPQHSQSPCSLVLRLLECLLQVTSQAAPRSINAENFRSFDVLFKQLLGAIYSEHFYFGSEGSRWRLAFTLMQCRARLASNVSAHLTWDLPISKPATSEVRTLARLFNEFDLDPSKVLIWQGWPCQNKAGTFTYPPLMPIYRRLGEEFTNHLYKLCATYVGGRRRTPVTAVHALSNFIGNTNREVTVSKLQQPDYTTGFFVDFYDHYLHTTYAEGRGWPVASIVGKWRGEISKFFHEFVFPSGLIAEPAGAFPTPRAISTLDEPTNIRVTADGEVFDKLLTPVPLHLTDDQALQLIFVQIKADLDAAKQWAWAEVQRMSAVLERRNILAARGGVRLVIPKQREVQFSTDWDHPDHLANAAATFEHYGYPCSLDVKRRSQLFPSPALRWADELAIPSTGSLVPHCAVIVADHPQITPSFLEELELFDKNGKIRAVVPTDSGEIVSGSKLRRGPRLAAQDINLSARAAFALDQMIRLTQPLRDYLRAKDDDAWRYLLLTSGRGFAYPRRVHGLSNLCSDPFPLQRIVESAVRSLEIKPEAAKRFAERFSISTLRASAAVVVYLESKSVEKMAHALGHAKYEVRLLDRYLPKSIRDFFQERWIRIFQTGIIVQALRDSSYLQRASGFASMDELDAFMRNHSLKVPPAASEPLESSAQDPWSLGNLPVHKEVVFGLNKEVLTLLLSIEKAATDPDRLLLPKAKYWAELTAALIPYVERTAAHRDDIQQYLAAAKACASADLVESIVYAN